MAESQQCFGIGAVLKLVTMYDETIQGEVMAFDLAMKSVILKCSASNGKPENHDIKFVNLNNLRHIDLVRGAPKSSTAPVQQILPNLNYAKLTMRKKANADEKMKRINYIGTGVSATAQKLFDTILKTIPEIEWNGDKILVMKSVLISPPYQAEDCQTPNSQIYQNNGQSLNHVKKIVTKFHDDNKETASTPSSTSSSSPPAVA